MFSTFTRTRQRIDRTRRIAEVLIKYGLGFVVNELGLAGPAWLSRRFGLDPQHEQRSLYVRVRLILEELGPTFIKLGQTLSTRTDLLPPGLIVELDRLQDNVPPFPFDIVRDVVESELNDTLEALFVDFDPAPLAAASIGQVHRATLPTGQPVVVKVQRPAVEAEMGADLLLMRDLSTLAERRTEWGKRYAVGQLVEEFGQQLQQQLDYSVEGHHADRFRTAMADVPDTYVPVVFWEYSGKRLLTTEYVSGMKINDFAAIENAGLDRHQLAARFVEIMAEQALESGVYHADPHPGNLLVRTDGTLVFMDFGMVGHIDAELKDQLVDLVLAVVERDADQIVAALLSIGIVRQRIDVAGVKQDVRKLLRKYYELPLSTISFGEGMSELFQLATKHQVRLPPDLSMLIKTAVTVEGLARQLDPGLSIVDVARPFATHIRRQRLSPSYMFREMLHEVNGARRLVRGLPVRLEALLRSLETGDVALRLELTRLGAYIWQFGIIINRLTAGIVVAAMFVTSALALRITEGPMWFGLSALAVVGLTLSTVLGLWLFIAIIRSGSL